MGDSKGFSAWVYPNHRNNMKVVGLDVCKNCVVACTLDSVRPSDPRQSYYDSEFPRFYTDASGIKGLLALKPDVAVMEPTGVNYSKLWAFHLTRAGVQVVLVGHKQLRKYRENLDLPDKDDQADALALACYYLEHRDSERRFVRQRDPIVAKIRDIVLRLAYLKRVQSPIINRTRQDLAWQFPEGAAITLDAPVFWGWLAGERSSKRYDLLYSKTVGMGLEPETKHNALAIRELQRRTSALELNMRSLLKDERFAGYRKVFAQFGFGERVEALILSQIYPISNYMGPDGLPEIRISKGKESGKPTKRYLSRRRFQKSLGVAPTREQSGDSKKTKKAGSELCRNALWQWLFTRIESRRCRLKSPIGEFLGALLDKEKACKPVALARARVMAKAADLLFQALVEQLCPSSLP
jgi:transposase